MVAVSGTQYGCAARKDAGPYVCKGVLINRAHADESILAEIRSMLLSPESISAIQTEFARLTKVDQQGDDKRKAETRLSALQAEIERLVDAIATTGISEALRERLRHAETERASLKRIVNAPTTQPATVGELVAQYQKVVANLDAALKQDIVEAREILRELVAEMVIRPVAGGIWAELKTNPAAAFADNGISSTNVVAGTGFEPVTFGL
jgi:site-specific DNA recombinase